MSYIMHVTQRAAWERAKQEGVYRTVSLENEGYIHCSTQNQVLRVANLLYKGVAGLVILMIDEARVKPEIKYERPAAHIKELFPHIYGELNLDAVVRVIDFPPGEDGSFKLPL